MKPEINLFGLCIPSYFMMYLLSYALSIVAIAIISKRANIPRRDIYLFAFFSIISGMVGARLLYILYNIKLYIQDISKLRMVIVTGFAFYGGLYGGLGGGFIYSKVAKKSFLQLSDYVLFVLPLAHAIRKFGCYMNGCCIGTKADGVIGKLYVYNGHNLHPVQLYESAISLAIFFILLILINKKVKNGTSFSIYMLLYGIGRFWTDFFRYDTKPIFMGLSTSQYLSITTFIIGIITLICIYKLKTKQGDKEIK